MSPLGPYGQVPNPDQPTDELPLPGGALAAGPPRPARRWPSDPVRRRAQYSQAEYLMLASAIKQHRRTGRSAGIAITAADRRLYARLDGLEQPN